MKLDKSNKLPVIENYSFEDMVVQSKIVEIMVWLIGMTALVYIDSLGRGEIAENTMAFAFGVSILVGLIQLNQLIKIDKILKGNRMVAVNNEYDAILKISFIPYTAIYAISIIDTIIGGRA